MQESLITFKTAKLAKEKGFELLTEKMYREDGVLGNSDFSTSPIFRAPTQSLLQKWLREVHNMHLLIEPYYNEQKVLVYGFDLILEKTEEETLVEKGFKTYEEALEVGLQKALKLIEIVKK